MPSLGRVLARGLGYASAKAERKLDRPALFGTEPIYSTVVRLGEDSRRENLAMNSAFFYSDISVLAQKVGKPKLNVLKRVGEGTEHLYDHPFERLFRRPNPLFSRAMLMQFSMAWLGLDGNAYLYLTTNAAGELAEIWPLPAREVKAIPHKDNVVSHYTWQPGGRQLKPIPVDKICHFRLVNPFSILHGRGFIMALKYTLEGNEARMKWNRDFFDKKRGIPEAIGSVPITTTDGDLQRIRDEAEREFGSGQRRVMWVRAGEIDVKRLGLTQEEMDFLGGMKFDGELIDRVCGFPGGYWDAKANRSNAEQAERSLAADTVEPILEMMAGEIEVQVIDRYYEDDEDLTCAFDSAVPEDRDLKVKEFQAYAPAMSYDEARGERGLAPVGGELGATPFVLMQALGQMVAGGFQPMPQVEAKWRERHSGELRDELRNWQKVALRAVAKGQAPREFYSDVIPLDVEDSIAVGLAMADTAGEVRAVFEPWLRDGAWRGYP